MNPHAPPHSYSAMARLSLDPVLPLPRLRAPDDANTTTLPPINALDGPGPSRTGRPHSQSVSSMTSPYSIYSSSTSSTMGSTSASASFVNLRSSFMNQSPPGSRYPLPPVTGYHSHSHSGSGRERDTQHPSLLSASLHRHHSASALPPGAHGPAYASNYQSSGSAMNRHHSQTPPAYYHSPYEYDPPTTRKRRSSTNGSRISLLGGAAAAADPSPSSSESRRLRGDSTGESDHGHGSGTNSPHMTPRTSYRMTPASVPTHTPGSAASTQRRQQQQQQHGFAVPGQSPGGPHHNTLPPALPQPVSSSSSMPNADPSAVRRLAHLQCEQRRRE